MDACTRYDKSIASRRQSYRLKCRLSIQLAALMTVTGCLDIATPPDPVWVTPIAGDAQVGEVGLELPQSIIVAVTGIAGKPVKGVEVRFVGDGNIVRSQARTDDNGRAWAYWELGPVAGEQSLRVTTSAPNVLETIIRASALPGPPASINLPSGAALVASPGVQLDTLVVTVVDRFGNRAFSAAVDWSVVQGGGSIKPVSAYTDSQGRARAVWTLGPSTGVHRVVVTSGAASRQIDAVTGALFTAVQVVAGADHACALNSEGVAFCWGTNWSGQLGRGSVDRQANPHAVAIAGHRFTMLAAGASHTCGLTNEGVAFCWGDNRSGQVGALSHEVSTPVRVAGAPAFVALTAGWFHTCGLTSDGSAYCWGDDSHGQLGRGTDRSAPAPGYYFRHDTPALVAGGHHFTSIASSPSAKSTCGVASGNAYCWGESVLGVLGSVVAQKCTIVTFDDYYYYEPVESKVPCSTSPLAVATHGTATSIIFERYTACVVLTTQQLECWGHDRGPTVIPDSRVHRAWALANSVCGESETGQVTCWRVPTYAVADPFGAVGPLVNLSSSGRVSCGISKETSVVYCWGSNFDGSLGDGTTLHRENPAPVILRP
jgi:hypothetical protein